MEELKSSKITEFDVYSDEVREVLSTPPRSIFIYGTSILIGVVLAFLLLTWFIRFPDIITTDAIITTKEAPVKLLTPAKGLLKHLKVKDGELIAKDSVIAVISNEVEYEDVLFLENFITSIKQNYKAIEDIAVLRTLAVGDIAIDLAELSSHWQKYSLLTKKYSVVAEAGKIRNQLLTSKELIGNLENKKENLELQLEVKQKNLDRQEELYKEGLVSALVLEQSKYDVAAEVSKKSELDFSIGELEVTINNLERQYESLMNTESREVMNVELDLFEVCNRVEAKIDVWKSQHVIAAPIKGHCSYLSYLQKNQYVTEEEALFVISPYSSNFIVRGTLPFEKSGLVKEGQKVILKLPSMPYKEYGTLNGTIEKTSLVSNDTGYMFFARLEKGLVSSNEIEFSYKPDMQADVEIVLEDLRLIERIFYEIKNIFEY